MRNISYQSPHSARAHTIKIERNETENKQRLQSERVHALNVSQCEWFQFIFVVVVVVLSLWYHSSQIDSQINIVCVYVYTCVKHSNYNNTTQSLCGHRREIEWLNEIEIIVYISQSKPNCIALCWHSVVRLLCRWFDVFLFMLCLFSILFHRIYSSIRLTSEQHSWFEIGFFFFGWFLFMYSIWIIIIVVCWFSHTDTYSSTLK